jgi:hypothetical protein
LACSCPCSVWSAARKARWPTTTSAGPRFDLYGIPSPDYWYWQLGLVTSACGFDVTVAYTDTSIEPAGCGNTSSCSRRVFVSVTKAF